MTKYSCNSTSDIYLLNQLCTNGSNSSAYECFKFYSPTADVTRQMSGIWLLVVGIIGILGNFATITTIPYAAKRKRHGLHRNYKTTTIFLLHLSFIDLLHCLFIVLPNGILYSSESSPFGQYGCTIIINGGISTFVADILALALVALSRSLDMNMNQKWTRFCDKNRNIILLLLLVWVPSLVSLSLSIFIQYHGIEPGWQCETGGCGFLRSCKYDDTNLTNDGGYNFRMCNDGIDVWRLTYFSTICVPIFAILIICISYIVIWHKVHKSKMYFVNIQETQEDTQENTTHLSEREMKMTRMILTLIVLNFLCWLPHSLLIVAALDFTSKPMPSTSWKYILKMVLVCMYESAYALNFFVYVARSEQYRHALLDAFWFSRRTHNTTVQLTLRRRDQEGVQS